MYVILVLWILALIPSAGIAQSESPPPAAADGVPLFDGLPLYLVENRGQVHRDVLYFVEGRRKTVYFTRTGVTIRLRRGTVAHVLKLEFAGARPEVRPVGLKRRGAVFSYFRGTDPAEWIKGAQTFESIVYQGLWPGIDLECGTDGNRLKFTYRVHAGADPSRIRVRIRGAGSVEVDGKGALHVSTPAGEVVDEPPEAYQEGAGRIEAVEAAYALDVRGASGPEYSFRIGLYDRTRPLVLDPAFLVYCGYIGGEQGDAIYGVSVDSGGHLYVAGGTGSDQKTFPVQVGPDLTYGGGADVFVAKVKADGTGLVYCGYLGGQLNEYARGIAVDAAGCVYLTGNAGPGYPLKVGPNTHMGGGAFVTKLNAAGTDIVYSGLIGGDKGANGRGIAVDQAGNAYVVGDTVSNENSFPVKVGPDLTFNSLDPRVEEGFVAKVNAQGTDLVYCGYIGGAERDFINAIAVDAFGRATVIGTTWSSPQSFPVKVGPSFSFYGTPGPLGSDAFVARVRADGTGLDYCGYISGSGYDKAYGVAVDAVGRAHVVGMTQSSEATFFPVTVGPDLTHNGGVADAFVCRVASSGTYFEYCGYIGGNSWEEGRAVALDGTGALYVAGTAGAGLPVKHALGLQYTDRDDVFVAKVDPSGKGLVYSGYIGGGRNTQFGTGEDRAHALAVDGQGNAYVAGETTSDEKSFPVKAGPDLTYNGPPYSSLPSIAGDAFVAKVALILLEGAGQTNPGGTHRFTITASTDPGRPYQVGTSLGTGPIMIDTRKLELTFDGVLWAAISGLFPATFVGYQGHIGFSGHAAASVVIPAIPALVGVKIHSAFLTLDASAPSGVRSISNTHSFILTRE